MSIHEIVIMCYVCIVVFLLIDSEWFWNLFAYTCIYESYIKNGLWDISGSLNNLETKQLLAKDQNRCAKL